MCGVNSDNPTGAENQQETGKSLAGLELDAMWVVGFIDGEGCFCVSVHRNPAYAKRTNGWQLHPVFQAYQHQRHRAVLEGLQRFFACGRIRPKGPRSSVLNLLGRLACGPECEHPALLRVPSTDREAQ